MNFKSLSLIALATLSFSTASTAEVIDFDNFTNGQHVTSVNYSFGSATITTKMFDKDGNKSKGQAWAYDTTNTANGDGDLTSTFDSVTGGVNDYNPGNILIIQENLAENAIPDDNAHGGVFIFNFDSDVTLESIDLFDASFNNVIITLKDSDNKRIARFRNDFDADTGNNDPNKYGTLDFGRVTGVSKMVVKFDDVSGGLDNIVITSAVPEPSTYALMLGGLGLVGFMARRRRQQR